MRKHPFAAVLGCLLVYLVYASIWTVRQNEEGVRVRFGRPVGTVSGGLHVTLPAPIERIRRVPTTEVRAVEIGLLFPEGKPRGRDLTMSGAHWLTGDTSIVALRANLLYTVSDPVTYLYGFAASDSGTTHEELIRATAEAVLTRLLASATIESTLATGKIVLAQRGLEETQRMLDDLQSGVRLSALNISEVQPPERVISAFNDVSSAKADRERLLAEAEGILGSTLPRAQARASQIIQSARTYSLETLGRAKGEAESFRKLAAECAKSPGPARERLWLEAMQRILDRTNERIVPPGSRVYLERLESGL